VRVVEDFLEHYNAQDWDALARCFSPTGFHRVGPYGDTIDSSAEYVSFLARVVPTLGERYRLELVRVLYADRAATAELVEHFEVNGEVRKTPEAIVYDLDADGLITSMHLYVQRHGEVPPAGGRDAMGHRDA
jgi:SnoaL-like domain